MYVTQVQGSGQFLEYAKKWGVPIRVVRTPTVVPAQVGGAILMTPAVVIQYTLLSPQQPDMPGGDHSVVYKGNRVQDAAGRIDLSSTLYAQLTGDTKQPDMPDVVLVHRSGSL